MTNVAHITGGVVRQVWMNTTKGKVVSENHTPANELHQFNQHVVAGMLWDGQELTYPPLPQPSQDEIHAAKVSEELAWRNGVLRQVIDGLDQIRNDADYSTQTYNKPYTPQQLNAMRVALCNYPQSPGFPFGQRPQAPEV
jgi:hypothetical protein